MRSRRPARVITTARRITSVLCSARRNSTRIRVSTPNSCRRGAARRCKGLEMNWLFKEEPTHYGFDAFVKDKKTVWSGVKNPVAQKHLRSVRKGDRVFYYHTGDEKAVVGIATAVGDAY